MRIPLDVHDGVHDVFVTRQTARVGYRRRVPLGSAGDRNEHVERLTQ